MSAIQRLREDLEAKGADLSGYTDTQLTHEFGNYLRGTGKKLSYGGESFRDDYLDIDNQPERGREGFFGALKEIPAGLEKGTEGLISTGFGGAGLTADYIPGQFSDASIRDPLMERAAQWSQKAAEGGPSIERFSDVRNPREFGRWFMGAIGEAVPSLVESIAAGAAGGGIGGLVAKTAAKKNIKQAVEDRLGKKIKDLTEDQISREYDDILKGAVGQRLLGGAAAKGKNIGQMTGVGISSVQMGMGEVYNNLFPYTQLDPSDDDYVSPEMARTMGLMGGLAIGGLDSVVPLTVLKRFNIPATKQNQIGVAKTLKNITKGMASEAVTEGLQEWVNISAEKYAHNDFEVASEFLPWNLSFDQKLRLLDAGALGAVGGFVFSGGAEFVDYGRRKLSELEARRDEIPDDALEDDGDFDTSTEAEEQALRELIEAAEARVKENEQDVLDLPPNAPVRVYNKDHNGDKGIVEEILPDGRVRVRITKGKGDSAITETKELTPGELRKAPIIEDPDIPEVAIGVITSVGDDQPIRDTKVSDMGTFNKPQQPIRGYTLNSQERAAYDEAFKLADEYGINVQWSYLEGSHIIYPPEGVPDTVNLKFRDAAGNDKDIKVSSEIQQYLEAFFADETFKKERESKRSREVTHGFLVNSLGIPTGPNIKKFIDALKELDYLGPNGYVPATKADNEVFFQALKAYNEKRNKRFRGKLEKINEGDVISYDSNGETKTSSVKSIEDTTIHLENNDVVGPLNFIGHKKTRSKQPATPKPTKTPTPQAAPVSEPDQPPPPQPPAVPWLTEKPKDLKDWRVWDTMYQSKGRGYSAIKKKLGEPDGLEVFFEKDGDRYKAYYRYEGILPEVVELSRPGEDMGMQVSTDGVKQFKSTSWNDVANRLMDKLGEDRSSKTINIKVGQQKYTIKARKTSDTTIKLGDPGSAIDYDAETQLPGTEYERQDIDPVYNPSTGSFNIAVKDLLGRLVNRAIAVPTDFIHGLNHAIAVVARYKDLKNRDFINYVATKTGRPVSDIERMDSREEMLSQLGVRSATLVDQGFASRYLDYEDLEWEEQAPPWHAPKGLRPAGAVYYPDGDRSESPVHKVNINGRDTYITSVTEDIRGGRTWYRYGDKDRSADKLHAPFSDYSIQAGTKKELTEELKKVADEPHGISAKTKDGSISVRWDPDSKKVYIKGISRLAPNNTKPSTGRFSIGEFQTIEEAKDHLKIVIPHLVKPDIVEGAVDSEALEGAKASARRTVALVLSNGELDDSQVEVRKIGPKNEKKVEVIVNGEITTADMLTVGGRQGDGKTTDVSPYIYLSEGVPIVPNMPAIGSQVDILRERIQNELGNNPGKEIEKKLNKALDRLDAYTKGRGQYTIRGRIIFNGSWASNSLQTTNSGLSRLLSDKTETNLSKSTQNAAENLSLDALNLDLSFNEEQINRGDEAEFTTSIPAWVDVADNLTETDTLAVISEQVAQKNALAAEELINWANTVELTDSFRYEQSIKDFETQSDGFTSGIVDSKALDASAKAHLSWRMARESGALKSGDFGYSWGDRSRVNEIFSNKIDSDGKFSDKFTDDELHEIGRSAYRETLDKMHANASGETTIKSQKFNNEKEYPSTAVRWARRTLEDSTSKEIQAVSDDLVNRIKEQAPFTLREIIDVGRITTSRQTLGRLLANPTFDNAVKYLKALIPIRLNYRNTEKSQDVAGLIESAYQASPELAGFIEAATDSIADSLGNPDGAKILNKAISSRTGFDYRQSQTPLPIDDETGLPIELPENDEDARGQKLQVDSLEQLLPEVIEGNNAAIAELGVDTTKELPAGSYFRTINDLIASGRVKLTSEQQTTHESLQYSPVMEGVTVRFASPAELQSSQSLQEKGMVTQAWYDPLSRQIVLSNLFRLDAEPDALGELVGRFLHESVEVLMVDSERLANAYRNKTLPPGGLTAESFGMTGEAMAGIYDKLGMLYDIALSHGEQTGDASWYGLTSQSEFIAELGANPRFFKFLNNIRLTRAQKAKLGLRGKGFIKSALDAILAFFARLLGRTPTVGSEGIKALKEMLDLQYHRSRDTGASKLRIDQGLYNVLVSTYPDVKWADFESLKGQREFYGTDPRDAREPGFVGLRARGQIKEISGSAGSARGIGAGLSTAIANNRGTPMYARPTEQLEALLQENDFIRLSGSDLVGIDPQKKEILKQDSEIGEILDGGKTIYVNGAFLSMATGQVPGALLPEKMLNVLRRTQAPRNIKPVLQEGDFILVNGEIARDTGGAGTIYTKPVYSVRLPASYYADGEMLSPELLISEEQANNLLTIEGTGRVLVDLGLRKQKSMSPYRDEYIQESGGEELTYHLGWDGFHLRRLWIESDMLTKYEPGRFSQARLKKIAQAMARAGKGIGDLGSHMTYEFMTKFEHNVDFTEESLGNIWELQSDTVKSTLLNLMNAALEYQERSSTQADEDNLYAHLVFKITSILNESMAYAEEDDGIIHLPADAVIDPQTLSMLEESAFGQKARVGDVLKSVARNGITLFARSKARALLELLPESARTHIYVDAMKMADYYGTYSPFHDSVHIGTGRTESDPDPYDSKFVSEGTLLHEIRHALTARAMYDNGFDPRGYDKNKLSGPYRQLADLYEYAMAHPAARGMMRTDLDPDLQYAFSDIFEFVAHIGTDPSLTAALKNMKAPGIADPGLGSASKNVWQLLMEAISSILSGRTDSPIGSASLLEEAIGVTNEIIAEGSPNSLSGLIDAGGHQLKGQPAASPDANVAAVNKAHIAALNTLLDIDLSLATKVSEILGEDLDLDAFSGRFLGKKPPAKKIKELANGEEEAGQARLGNLGRNGALLGRARRRIMKLLGGKNGRIIRLSNILKANVMDLRAQTKEKEDVDAQIDAFSEGQGVPAGTSSMAIFNLMKRHAKEIAAGRTDSALAELLVSEGTGLDKGLHEVLEGMSREDQIELVQEVVRLDQGFTDIKELIRAINDATASNPKLRVFAANKNLQVVFADAVMGSSSTDLLKIAMGMAGQDQAFIVKELQAAINTPLSNLNEDGYTGTTINNAKKAIIKARRKQGKLDISISTLKKEREVIDLVNREMLEVYRQVGAELGQAESFDMHDGAMMRHAVQDDEGIWSFEKFEIELKGTKPTDPEALNQAVMDNERWLREHEHLKGDPHHETIRIINKKVKARIIRNTYHAGRRQLPWRILESLQAKLRRFGGSGVFMAQMFNGIQKMMFEHGADVDAKARKVNQRIDELAKYLGITPKAWYNGAHNMVFDWMPNNPQYESHDAATDALLAYLKDTGMGLHEPAAAKVSSAEFRRRIKNLLVATDNLNKEYLSIVTRYGGKVKEKWDVVSIFHETPDFDSMTDKEVKGEVLKAESEMWRDPVDLGPIMTMPRRLNTNSVNMALGHAKKITALIKELKAIKRKDGKDEKLSRDDWSTIAESLGGDSYFDGNPITESILVPYITSPSARTRWDGPLDGQKLSNYEVRKAWELSGEVTPDPDDTKRGDGRVGRMLDALYDASVDEKTADDADLRAEWHNKFMVNFLAKVNRLIALKNKSEARAGLFRLSEGSSDVIAHAREDQEIPWQFLNYQAFDEESSRIHLAHLVANINFGHNNSALKEMFKSLQSELKEQASAYLGEVANATNEPLGSISDPAEDHQTLKRLIGVGNKKKVKAAIAKRLGSQQKAEELAYAAKLWEDFASTTDGVSGTIGNYLGSKDNVFNDTAFTDDLLRFIAWGMVNKPTTGAMSWLSVPELVNFYGGFNRKSAKALATAFTKGTGSMLKGLFSALGREVDSATRIEKSIFQLDRAGLDTRDALRTHGVRGRFTGEDTGVLDKTSGILRRIMAGFTHTKSDGSGAPFGVRTLFTNAFNYFTQAATYGIAEGMIAATEQHVREVADYIESNNIKGEVTAEMLGFGSGLDRAVWGNKDGFDKLNGATEAYGIGSLSYLARDYISRRKNGDSQVLTEDAQVALAQMGLAEVSFDGAGGRPAILLSDHLITRLSRPLLGWSLSALQKAGSRFATGQDKIDAYSVVKGSAMMATWFAPIGMVAAMLLDEYDEEVLGKPSNYQKTSPQSMLPMGFLFTDDPKAEFIAGLERLARTGTTGGMLSELAGSLASMSDPSMSPKNMSLDSRVFAFAIVRNLGKSMSNFIHSGARMDFRLVIQPSIYALGGSGVMHYSQAATNLLPGVDKLPFMSQVRASADYTGMRNTIRASSRFLGLELRPSMLAGGTRTTPFAVAMRNMELAAYADSRDSFNYNYRIAIEEARKRGKPDPRKYVGDQFKTRRINNGITARAMDDQDWSGILKMQSEKIREKMERAMLMHSKYLSYIYTPSTRKKGASGGFGGFDGFGRF